MNKKIHYFLNRKEMILVKTLFTKKRHALTIKVIDI